MLSVGEKLEHERESRNRSVEEMALATGIRLLYLEALEKNEFHTLPGRAFGKLYIRAYAEVLGFDPQSLIDEYDREQHLRRPISSESTRPEPVEPRRVAAVIARWKESRINERSKPERGVLSGEAERDKPDETRTDTLEVRGNETGETRDDEIVEIGSSMPERQDDATVVVSGRGASWAGRPFVLSLVLLGLLLGIAVTRFTFFRKEIDQSAAPAVMKAPPPIVSAPEPRPVEASKPPTAPPPPARPIAAAKEGPGHLSVSESGVGRRIVRRRLEGETDRFAEGDVAWFSTRVLGGRPGDSIRHVWLHEGMAMQSIKLGVGGQSWRTYSSRRLWKSGRWVVEARDEDGRVLARSVFTCAADTP